jgi:hypothetical protein
MSTRSIILVTGAARRGNGHSTTRLYKHSDGYPTGAFEVFAVALERANAQITEDRLRFGARADAKHSVDQVVGQLIGAGSSVYGMGVQFDMDTEKFAQYHEPLKPEHFGNQSDLEWMYVIDLDKKEVRVFGGGYDDKPGHAKAAKLADPFDYVKKLIPQAQARERETTKEFIDQLHDLGFTVVYKKKSAKKGA